MFITNNNLKTYKELKNINSDTNLRKIFKNLEQTDEFILFSNVIDKDYKNKEKVVVLTSDFSDNFSNNYTQFLTNILLNTISKYSNYKYLVILNAYKVKMPQDILSKPYIVSGVSIGEFSRLCSNFNKIKNEIYNENDKIITLGNAIYSITQNSTINSLCFDETPFSFPFFITNRFNVKGTKIYPLSQDILQIILESVTKKEIKIKDNEKELDKRLKIIFKDIFNIIEYPQPKKVIINNLENLDNIINIYNNDKYKYIAWDTETSSLIHWKAKLGCITFSFDGITGYYLPYSLICNNANMLAKFNNLINSKISILANGKYDLKILESNNFKNLRIDNDVISLGRIIDNERYNGLKPLSYYYTNLGGYDDYLDIYKKENNLENYLDIPEEILSQYAIIDSIVTYRVYFNLLKHLRLLDENLPNDFCYKHIDKDLTAEDGYKYKERSLEYNYRNLVIPTLNNFVNIELNGVYIDLDMHKKMCNDLMMLINYYYKKFDDSIGLTKYNQIHPKYLSTSNTQLAEYIEKILHWHCIERTRIGKYKLSDDILETYRQEHPEITYLQTARTLSTLYGICAGSYDDNSKNLLVHTNNNESLLDDSFDNIDFDIDTSNDNKNKNGWVPFINTNHKDYETDIYYITQNNKTYKLLKDQIVKTNNGKKLAQDLVENDILEI